MDTSQLCSICGNRVSYNSCLLPCNHQFCRICISEWCTQSNLCPICQKKFSRVNELVNNEQTGFVFSAKALSQLYETSQVIQNSSSFSTQSSTFQAAQRYKSEESIDLIEKDSIQSGHTNSSTHRNTNSKLTLSTKQKERKKVIIMPKLVLSSIQH